MIELNVDKPAYGGFGLGFASGKAVFVPYAIPGDRLNVIVTRDKKDFAFAKISEILAPSQLRIAPECPNFTSCGGCDYLCMDYDSELDIKRRILMDALSRIAGLEKKDIPEVETVSGSRRYYRSHASLKIDSHSGFGFYQRESNTVAALPIQGCLLLAGELTEFLHGRDPSGQDEQRIAMDRDGRIFMTPDVNAVLHEVENGIFYERDIDRFFQSNRFLRSKMLTIVTEFAALKQNESFLDIGCGVGFFALSLGKNGIAGAGIDMDRKSISWAVHNARLNDIKSVEFFPNAVESLNPLDFRSAVLILDPPRAGLSRKARDILKAVDAPRMVYVSCNPSTFARDVRDFTAAGYRMVRLCMIDMFPSTGHIEVIGLLVKAG